MTRRCTGCSSELTTGDLCGVCLANGWEQRACGCIVDPLEELVVRCEDCEQHANERAYERFCDDFYGGGGPVTIQEQHEAAWRQKRSLR